MGVLEERRTEIQARLDEIAAKHGVPGMALGLLSGEETLEAATGVVNIDTGVRATPDAVFQIGSVTKMYTATLVIQLVAQGVVDLRAPITTYLPELRMEETADTSGITVLHLLTHTSGIEGDCFFDTGRGDDAIEKLVASLDRVGLIHAPGAMWSYANSGFVLAGRIIEKITGLPWHEALDAMLLTPLGVQTPVTLSDDVIRYRAAVGHVRNAETGSLETTSIGQMPFSNSPAGSRSFARVGDVLRFARLHLDGGLAADGVRLLPEDLVRSMQDHHFDQPLSLTRGQGIGWFLLGTEPELLLTHVGETSGFLSLLLVAPERGFALVSLANAEQGLEANIELALWAGSELVGITAELPGQRAAGTSPPPDDLSPFAGTYRRLGAAIEVAVDGSELVVHTDFEASLGPAPATARLRPISATVFRDTAGGVFPSEFLDFDEEGRPRYFHSGLRAHRRTEPDAALADTIQ